MSYTRKKWENGIYRVRFVVSKGLVKDQESHKEHTNELCMTNQNGTVWHSRSLHPRREREEKVTRRTPSTNTNRLPSVRTTPDHVTSSSRLPITPLKQVDTLLLPDPAHRTPFLFYNLHTLFLSQVTESTHVLGFHSFRRFYSGCSNQFTVNNNDHDVFHPFLPHVCSLPRSHLSETM